ncbi:hypothetical protein [Lacticaseibacillus suihuaensis]
MLRGSKLKFYRQFASHGAGDTLVLIEPKEVVLLATITRLDLHDGRREAWMDDATFALAKRGLYAVDAAQLAALPAVSEEQAYEILHLAAVDDNDEPEYLYLSTLAMLYRRRVKYARILQTQPFPTANQIAPRAILEYGLADADLLFAWMSWRKLAYDLDNRSAQETGYSFEPLLVGCLGGTSLGAKVSVVHRLNAQGEPTPEGRQVDCYVAATQTVYELKMRMTIAASGQGRFSEELSFPKEAAAAGLTPVLVVLDPTPSPRLAELRQAYLDAGGSCAVGEAAWQLLAASAEAGMNTFIETYIHPVFAAAAAGITPQPTAITLRNQGGAIEISDDTGRRYTIHRTPQ